MVEVAAAAGIVLVAVVISFLDSNVLSATQSALGTIESHVENCFH